MARGRKAPAVKPPEVDPSEIVWLAHLVVGLEEQCNEYLQDGLEWRITVLDRLFAEAKRISRGLAEAA